MELLPKIQERWQNMTSSNHHGHNEDVSTSSAVDDLAMIV
jgi:hypothetical protein